MLAKTPVAPRDLTIASNLSADLRHSLLILGQYSRGADGYYRIGESANDIPL